MNITVVGLGYVGTANAVLFAQQHTVIALDISAAKVSAINAKQSPIADTLLDTFLNEKTLNLHATLNKEEAYRHADIIIIATPTNFNPDTNSRKKLKQNTLPIIKKMNGHLLMLKD